MRIRLAIPDRHVTAPVLDAALEATTQAATSQMTAGEAPTFTDLLRQGVRWQPERFTDGEHFDLPSVVAERGNGDCDDLAPALAAELRATGADPHAVARVVRSGPERWHAIVELSDGRIVDPSRMAGMKGSRSVRGALARPMAAVGESGLAIVPWRGEWWARTDVPSGEGHFASHAHDRDLRRALDRSIGGAVVCGSCVGWQHAAAKTALARLYEQALEAEGPRRALARELARFTPWRETGIPGGMVARF
jgi:hypothetical protein